MEVFFPSTSESPRLKEYYSQLQRRTILVLQGIRGADTGDQVRQIDRVLFEMYTPRSFTGRHSEEVKFIKGFEEAVIYLSQHTPRDPKKMTVLEFYQALETIRKQNKKNKKLNGQPN